MVHFYILSLHPISRTTDNSLWSIILGGFQCVLGEEEERFLTAFPEFLRVAEDGELRREYTHKCPSMTQTVPPFSYIQKILEWLSRNSGKQQEPQVSLATHKDSYGNSTYTWTLNVPS